MEPVFLYFILAFLTHNYIGQSVISALENMRRTEEVAIYIHNDVWRLKLMYGIALPAS